MPPHVRGYVRAGPALWADCDVGALAQFYQKIASRPLREPLREAGPYTNAMSSPARSTAAQKRSKEATPQAQKRSEEAIISLNSSNDTLPELSTSALAKSSLISFRDMPHEVSASCSSSSESRLDLQRQSQ